jgi:histidine decarboxylase
MRARQTGFHLSADDQRRLDELFATILREQECFVGYPCNALFNYHSLFKFLDYPINNVGDPYVDSNFHLNTHVIEREVLGIFHELTHAVPEESWGYISSGGTEGNMYGIFLGRELYPEGMVYYSEDTHYSVNKILRCLHVRNIMIKSCPDGRIDLEDLRETIRIHRDLPPIIFANVGTTMRGAIDDLEGIRAILDDLAIHRAYIHADAALSGMVLPFVDDPEPWDFRAGIDSIAISGHKMVGSPLPCGIVLAKRAHVDRIARSVEYVGTLDTTILGSRNAVTPLFMWYALRTVGIEGFRRWVRQCFETADYAIARLGEIGRNAWRHRNSVTVVFDRPSPEMVHRWQLAAQHNIAHLITMPHVTREQIDRLVDELARKSPVPATPKAKS